MANNKEEFESCEECKNYASSICRRCKYFPDRIKIEEELVDNYEKETITVYQSNTGRLYTKDEVKEIVKQHCEVEREETKKQIYNFIENCFLVQRANTEALIVIHYDSEWQMIKNKFLPKSEDKK
jgi:hypothetical protein